MKIDLSKYTETRRAKLIELGRPYASSATQELSDAFINSLSLHADALKPSGYADEDGERLAALCAMSKEALAARPEVARGRTDARKAARAAVKQSKQLRLDARTILEMALGAGRDELDEGVVRQYETILEQTASSGADAATLRGQLLSLAQAFELPALKARLKARGGAQTAAALRAQADVLEQTNAAAQLRNGTPEQTATLDLLDGLLIEQLRAIRRVARRAATRVGDPTIADAFALGALD